MTPIRKLFVANRAEIALRIVRTARRLGIETVVPWHRQDAKGPALAECSETVEMFGEPPVAAWLDVAAMIAAARETGCDAVHPGYGFLSENARFAQAVTDAGLVFVGPPARVIEQMGDKITARRFAVAHGVPVTPSADEADAADAAEGHEGHDAGDEAEAIEAADKANPARGADAPDRASGFVERARAIGLPLLVKAAAGGGGKGMHIVRREADLLGAITQARSESQRYFGDGRLFAERFVERPRHIEVQVFGDAHGNVIHLGERECSIQRRFQKLVEESPAPGLDGELRNRLCEAAVRLARAADYVNAGTVEFIVDPQGDFYFLEMNTRLQVEHPVTEMVTGLDLVELQLRVAAGEPLGIAQGDVRRSGHAIECRILAEDADAGFVPDTGKLLMLRKPEGPGVRFDVGVCEGATVTADFDSMLAKLVVHGAGRALALSRMKRALDDTVMLGVTVNSAFLARVVANPAFARGAIDTAFLERHREELAAPAPSENQRLALLAAAACAAFDPAEVAAPEPYASMGAWRN